MPLCNITICQSSQAEKATECSHQKEEVKAETIDIRQAEEEEEEGYRMGGRVLCGTRDD